MLLEICISLLLRLKICQLELDEVMCNLIMLFNLIRFILYHNLLI